MDKHSGKKIFVVVLPLIFALFAYFMSSLLRLSAVVAMPIMQEQLNLSSSIVGVVSSFFYVTYALMQVLGGALCIRFGTLAVLCGVFTISGLGSFLFAIASSPSYILIGRVLLGLGVGSTFVIVISIIQQHFEGSKYSQWMGYAFVASNTGAVFSSAPLQMAINRFGIRSLFTFFAEILFVCAILTCILIKLNGKQNISKQTGIIKQFKDVSKTVMNSKILCGCFIIWIVMNAILGVYQSLWCVKWTSCAFPSMPQLSSYSGTLIGIGIILGCLLGEILRKKNKPRFGYIIFLAVVQSLSLLLLTVVKTISDSLLWLVLSLFIDVVYGYALGAVCIQLGTVIRENSDASQNALIMGIMNCINNLTSMGLQSLSGVLIDFFAISHLMSTAFANTFYIYTGVNFIFVLFGLYLVSFVRKE